MDRNLFRIKQVANVTLLLSLSWLCVAAMRVQQREHSIDGSELSIRVLESLTEDLRDQECAVRVSGLEASLSRDFVDLHFESERRSGGGEIEDKFYMPSTGVVVITFKSPQGKPVHSLAEQSMKKLIRLSRIFDIDDRCVSVS